MAFLSTTYLIRDKNLSFFNKISHLFTVESADNLAYCWRTNITSSKHFSMELETLLNIILNTEHLSNSNSLSCLINRVLFDSLDKQSRKRTNIWVPDEWVKINNGTITNILADKFLGFTSQSHSLSNMFYLILTISSYIY